MVEVGVVVDLDDEDAVIGLLEVDAVEPVADAAGGAHRRLDDMRRRFLQREGLDAALVGLARRLVVDDLPVLLGHQVVDGKERLAAEHADPPVILGRDEFLGDQQVGIFQPDSASAFSSAKSAAFLTPREKALSGIFSTSGKPSVCAATSRSAVPAIITVGGIGTLL